MYIAQRLGQVRGPAGGAWALEITQAVQAAGVPASLWQGGPGTVPGSVGWSTMVTSMAELHGYLGALEGDAKYLELAQAGQDHVESMQADRLLQIVHGEITERTPVGGVVGMVTANINPGHGNDARTWAPTVADAWTSATGVPAVVASNAAGDMGEIHWIVAFADASAVDAANGKAMTSEAYLAELAAGDDLFASGTQSYAFRVA